MRCYRCNPLGHVPEHAPLFDSDSEPDSDSDFDPLSVSIHSSPDLPVNLSVDDQRKVTFQRSRKEILQAQEEGRIWRLNRIFGESEIFLALGLSNPS